MSYERSRPPQSTSREDKERHVQFTSLTKTPQEILATEDAKFSFRPPRPMGLMMIKIRTSTASSMTIQGITLMIIEAAMQSGELAHLVKDIRQKNEKGKKDKGKEKKQKEALMVYPYKRIWRDEDEPLGDTVQFPTIFPPLLANTATDKPMIVKALVEVCNVSGALEVHLFCTPVFMHG
ncbi:hypothetical protein R6Q59_015846 [Mikania micrantha]